LVAHRLTFIHPITGATTVITAPSTLLPAWTSPSGQGTPAEAVPRWSSLD
jgi:hypothetical protein